MRTPLIIIILIFSSTLFGQSKTLTNVINGKGDTSFGFKYHNLLAKDLSFSQIDTSTSPFHFRVWKTNQVLDIFQNSDGSYAGELTSWLTEQTPDKEDPTDRILVDKRKLSIDTIKNIICFIEASQINKLPTDDSIPGWKHGFDGITYTIETSTQKTYSFKTYWTPTAQDTTLTEARYLQSFIDRIFEFANSTTAWIQFEKSIPYECYNVGMTIRCKVLTKKQKRHFLRERKIYRQQRFTNSRVRR
ncbi:hypothetical protein [Parasegetibacter sp. NRK P23]|uniref:hypothetical protein n=1 Tax=Parasegetibacter sp. NRK P23 TaxID=2942999 RepID=UPI002043E78B|nr:hypothetical protein [Parasegetibacter sp. NRK P23]MCM5530641.1 hypothetical protein [Parasegetibacter sp. NRK P23]